MAYSKTNWVNNTTLINETNLNKIEQGIYDNSLVVDAVTNTLNPTDTETYKTAELTEGQITDVIGINDIVIKGQTSQDGTPTPSAPIDINVVSGSNVIKTNNKNFFDKNTVVQGDWNNPGLSTVLVSYIGKISTGDKYTVSNYNSRRFALIISSMPTPSNQASALQSSGNQTATQFTFTATASGYLMFRITKTDGSSITPNEININDFQIEKGSISTTYEPHQGKELPLDLPVENLINPQNLELYGNYRYIKTADDYYINVNANTAYTFSIKEFTGDGRLYEYDKDNNLLKENQLYSALTNGYITIITTENTKKIRFYASMYSSTPTEIPTVYTPQCMLFKGSLPSPYTPYGTEPIELCKIGNYQDYIYKSGSKWYLHKEINRIKLDGSESISILNTGTANWFYRVVPNVIKEVNSQTNQICNYYNNVEIFNSNTTQGIMMLLDGTSIRIRYGTEDTVANFKTWLSNNNVILYCQLKTVTDTEITDTTLISQLEAIYNAPLYEQTNITQTNNDLPMILDITACKDNINGIKAFIRK